MEPRSPGSGIALDFTVGDWFVRPSTNLIRKGSRSIQLEPKVMQMLVILAARAGEVITRDELHERLWVDTIVTDKALTRLASELRKAFGDDPRNPRILATVSKSGYRLVAPVSTGSGGDGSVRAPGFGNDSAFSMGDDTERQPISVARWILASLGAIIVVLGVRYLVKDDQTAYQPAVQITSYRGHEISPAISPGGGEIAFSWQGSDENNWDIYVKQPGSDGLLRLTTSEADDLHPTWSPDGTRIAFVSYDHSTCMIKWTPALSGPIRAIGSCEWIEQDERPYRTSTIHWSPDGMSIAASNGGIYLIDVESGAEQILTTPPRSVLADINPVFSPDGRSILFARFGRLATSDLYRVSLSDTAATQLTDDTRLILGHDWSRDGKRVLYSSNRGGRFGIWKMPADGGESTPVAADGWNIEKISMSRGSSRLAYEGWIYDTNIWRVSTDTTTPASRIIASTLWDRHPAISPDGNRIAFVSNRSGSWEIWIGAADGSNQMQITRFDGPVVGAPKWAPDGKRLAVQVQRRGGADIVVVHPESGLVTPFADHGADDVAPCWSSTGREIFFGSHRGQNWQIWSKSLDGGEAVQLTTEGGYAAQASKDGQSLFFTRGDSAGLWHQPILGGPAVRILDYPLPGDWGNWEVHTHGIYLLRRRGTDYSPVLALSSLDGSTVRDILELDPAPSPYHPGFTVHPDGRSVFVTRVDATESDLFVIEMGDR